MLQLDEVARSKGVIAASAGNHAQGLAYHATRLGIPSTIVMPLNTPTVKITQTEGHGANVILHGETFDAAYAHSRELEAGCGYTFVHPFDDVRVIAGQGTAALEMLEDVPEIDTWCWVIPIGRRAVSARHGRAGGIGGRRDHRSLGRSILRLHRVHHTASRAATACRGIGQTRRDHRK